jgi:hypothetical protein
VAVTITTNIPIGNWAGSFGYQITTNASDWTASGVTDPGANINDTIAPPLTAPALPTIAIQAPTNNTQYTWVATGGPLSIPYSFVGSTQNPSGITAMTATVNSNPIPLTVTGLDQNGTNATASGSFLVDAPGEYTVTADDADSTGVNSTAVMINVVASAPPPTVVIDTPPANSTYILTGNEVDVPFTFTGNSLAPNIGGITLLTATLDGSPVTVTSSQYGDEVALGGGTLALTSTGPHELTVTATDNYGSATTSETIFVNAQSTLIPPSANILTPTANQVYTTVVGTPIVANLSFNGTTTGDPITSLVATVDNTTVTATANGTQTATLNGNSVVFTFAGLGTQTATGTANVSYSTAGNHTLNVVATNDGGNASTTTDYSVVTTQPATPTLAVAITKPAPNSTYAIATVGGSVSIPDGFVANSTAASGVTALSVTLGLNGATGSPVTVTPTAFGKPTVTANGTLSISVAGTYTIKVTATDQNGNATASENITVTAPVPCPKVTITSPCDGATFQIGSSTCPLWVPVNLTANTTPGSTLSTLTLTVNGQAETLTSVSGLGKTAATGSVNLQITAPGTYTLVATTTSGNVSATCTHTFTVSNNNGCGNGGGGNNGGGNGGGGWGNNGGGSNGGGCWNITQYTCNPPPCNITWEQSWSCNTTQKGGSSLPFCFQVQYTGSKCSTYWSSYYSSCGDDYEGCDKAPRSCWSSSGYFNCLWGNVLSSNYCLNGNWDSKGGCTVSSDNTVKCVVYEVYSNGSCSKPQTFTCPSYSSSGWGRQTYNPGTGCSINSNDQYSCNFATSSGTHTYRCDVYYTDQNSGQDCFLGSEQCKTK